MSDYSSIKATINANVKANNNHEITGSIMNSVLTAMVNSLGAGYQYIGVATPTNPGSAQTPDYRCFYIATTPGTYTYLGGLVVADGEVAILKYDSSWTKEVTGIATADQLNQLGQKVDDLYSEISGEVIPLNITEFGKYIPTNAGIGGSIGQVTSGADFNYIRHSAHKGDKVTLSGHGGYTPRLWAFVDKDGKILSAAVEDLTLTNAELVAPESSEEIIINVYNTFPYGPFYFEKAETLNEEISQIEEEVEQLTPKILTDVNNVLFGGQIYNYLYARANPGYIANSASSGTLPAPTASEAMKYILFPVFSGDTFSVRLFTGVGARAWTIVDKSLSIIQTAEGGSYNITNDIVIKNDGYILFNFFIGTTEQGIEYNGLGVLRKNVLGAIEYPINLVQTREKSALYQVDGTEVSSAYKTKFFGVEPGDSILVSISQFPTEGYSIVSAWNNGVFVSSLISSPINQGEYTFEVPENCTEIGVSLVLSADKLVFVNEAISLLQDKRSIKCLFIGNSVSQDHVSYLPWLLKNTYPNVYFEIYQAYCAGKTIKEYITDIIPNDTPIEIFSEAKNTQIWTNRTGVTFDDMFDFATFDLICFEGYFHDTDHGGSDEDTAYFEQLISHIRSLQNTPFKLAYLIHQQYDDDVYPNVNVLQQLINAARFTIANNEVTMIFPCGLVTELVKSSFGTSFLTPDNIHNNQGLPCIMGAYTLLGNIAKYLGLQDKIINNQNRITSEVETSLNIPGPNGTLKIGTDSQYEEAQSAAVMAMKYGDYLTTDAASTIIQI